MIGSFRSGSTARCAVLMGLAVGCLSVAAAVRPYGNEYRVTRPLPGDQVAPHLALGPAGGLLVWHDNRTDGSGLGISARWLDANFSGTYDSFRVNQIGADDQEHPQVSLLEDGGAVFVWQGGVVGRQRIYARFLNADGTFGTGDVEVSSYTANMQQFPVVSTLTDGNVVVVWMSFGQDGDKFGVFGQRFSSSGQKLGPEFQVNQTTANNQRNPAVCALPDGGFYVVWINERYRGVADQSTSGVNVTGMTVYDVQVYGRRFNAAGQPLQAERALSDARRLAANPVVVSRGDGKMLMAYSGRAVGIAPGAPGYEDRWDIWAAALDAEGSRVGEEYRVNAHLPGDQYQPQLAAMGERFMAVWTSLGQDGSREGVFGRATGLEGPVGEEMQINTFWPSQQLYPTVASVGADDALVVWSSFVGGAYSFELLGQRLSALAALAAPQAPFVTALSGSQLVVTWPTLEGFDLECYELYIDGAGTPVEVAGNRHYLTKLAPGSSHTVQLAYRLADGRRSPLSAAVSGTTWGEDANHDGLPDDWQAYYWGPDPALWPGPHVDSDGDGATNLQEFLAGTDPTDPASVLRLSLEASPQGVHLVWSTQPGSVYQVQIADALGQWSPLGGERLAAGITDSLLVDGGHGLQMFRVVRIR